jgi:hypothetical protein
MNHDVETYLAGKPPAAVVLFRHFRSLVLAAGECEERVHRTEVSWAVRRVFASAFIYAERLEVVIDLLRRVDHPALLQAFPTTRKIQTHRFTFTATGQMDAAIEDLLVEAHDNVGPGTR